MFRRSRCCWMLPCLFLVCANHYGSTAGLIGTPTSISNHPADKPSPAAFRIEKVSTVDQCLDVLVFRRRSMQVDKQMDASSSTTAVVEVSSARKIRQEIAGRLPRSIQEYQVGGGKTIQFVATTGNTNTNNNEKMVVVGAVDCILEPRILARTFSLPDRIHIQNLRVCREYRRQGIGRALLLAVENQQHTMEQQGDNIIIPQAVTLKVEAWINPSAVQLYQQEGFTFQEEVYPGFMMKSIT